MFIGEYNHTLDSKKRIIMPAKFRSELGQVFFVTKGFDGCLTVYKKEQWENLLLKLEQLPNTKTEIRKYIRQITSRAIECECDNQGRIQLNIQLIEHADLVKDCVFIGAADHVELWSKDRWESYYDDSSDSFDEVAESLTEFLL